MINSVRVSHAVSTLFIRPFLNVLPCRHKGLNVFLPKWRSLRKRKVIVPDLPDFNEFDKMKKLPSWEYRKLMKEEGHLPPRSYEERPINISNSGQIFNEYVPTEETENTIKNETKTVIPESIEYIKRNTKYYRDVAKIRSFEKFDQKEFANMAQTYFIQAHEALARNDEDKLHQLVTEKALAEMQHGLKYKTLVWLLNSVIEPPRVVHVCVQAALQKGNDYAQVTIRMHTMQLISIFDRFGRLIHGDRHTPKALLQFIVFEKHLNGHYPLWRIHGKITPAWQKIEPETSQKTYRSSPKMVTVPVQQ